MEFKFNVFFYINHLCNKGVPKLMNKTQHKCHLREPKDIIAIIGVKKLSELNISINPVPLRYDIIIEAKWELNCRIIEIICICIDSHLCLGELLKKPLNWYTALQVTSILEYKLNPELTLYHNKIINKTKTTVF